MFERVKKTLTCIPRWAGATQQSFIRGGFAPRSKPLPNLSFYTPFLREKVLFLYTFRFTAFIYRQRKPLNKILG